MPMPNKHTTDNNYRYAFQGQEKDGETNMEAFELRLWDGRLGRWLTVDPKHEFHSPYVGMGNNPISLIDPDGGATDPPTEAGKNYGDIWESGGDTYTWIKGEEGKSDMWFLTGFTGNEIKLTGTVKTENKNSKSNSEFIIASVLTASSLVSENYSSKAAKLANLKNFEIPSFHPSGSYEYNKIIGGISDGKIYLEGTTESIGALKTISKVAKGVSYGAGGLGFILSVDSQIKGEISKELLALDGAMTIVSYIGPYGAAIGGVYFIIVRTGAPSFINNETIQDIQQMKIDNTKVHIKNHRFDLK